MYIETIPNRSSPPAILLREARREGKKIVKRTLANLSHWPGEQVEAFRLLLRGERLVPAGELFRIQRALPHGHVEAILRMIEKLGLDTVIASKRCRERDLILATIVERLIHPRSKLANTRHWNDTTLSEELSVANVDVDELYDALDWLLGRQKHIEKKLASRHLEEGGLFRCMKGTDLRVRPIYHHTEDHVRAHTNHVMNSRVHLLPSAARAPSPRLIVERGFKTGSVSHLPVPAGLLRGVAPAGGMVAIAVPG